MFGFRKKTLRSNRLKDKRRRRLLILTSTAVLVLVLFVTGLSYLSQASFITINKIIVEGNATINEQRVLDQVQESISGKYWWLFAKNNIFLYPKNEIENLLASNFVTAKGVKVHRKSLQSIVVELDERQNDGLWCKSNVDCYFMDEGGFIFGEADLDSFVGTDVSRNYNKYFGGLENPAMPIGQSFLNPDSFAQLQALVTALPSLKLVPTATIKETTGDYEIRLESGSKILLNDSTSFITAFSNLDSLWKSPEFQQELSRGALQYLDLRFGNKILYKIN